MPDVQTSDDRPKCERCLRPKATDYSERTPGLCWRGRWDGDGMVECDRLLLERAQRAERERDMYRSMFGRTIEERDALAEAGDRLAEALESLAVIPGRSGGMQHLADIWTAWRALRPNPGGHDA